MFEMNTINSNGQCIWDQTTAASNVAIRRYQQQTFESSVVVINDYMIYLQCSVSVHIQMQ